MFEFEIGLSPQFDVSLKNKKAIESFEIEADNKMIDGQIENIQNQYGKLISKNKVEEKFELNGSFLNKEFEIDNDSNFKLNSIKGKSNKDSIISDAKTALANLVAAHCSQSKIR